MTQVGIGWVPGSIYGSISAQEFIASAPWNPYQGDLSAPQTPQIRIVMNVSSAPTCRDRGLMGGWAGALCLSSSLSHPTSSCQFSSGICGQTSYRINGLTPDLVSFHAQVQPDAANVRITWFLDRIGNLPFNGADISLDLNALAPGKHTLLVYGVDGEQNYAMASFMLEV